MAQDFVPLAERIVDAVLESNPFLAAFAGDHRYDDRLPDWSPDGVAGDVAMLRDAANALSQVDIDALDRQDGVDHAVLLALVERLLFEHTEVREHEWNPLDHNPGGLLYGMLHRPYAPAEERLTAMAGRLAAIPDALSTARGVLTDCPRIHLETAVGQFTGAAALVRDDLSVLLAQAPALADRVQPVRQEAVRALQEFVDWLRARLEAPAGNTREPRLGRRLWEARLWHTLDTELSAAEVLSRAEANMARAGGLLREACAEYSGGPATDATVRAVLDRLADDRPDDTTIVGVAKACMDEATAFVRSHDLVSLVDDPCEILEMPEFSRGIAAAYCDAPGPLETARMPTFFCISPTPAGWSPERVVSFYREYNNHMMHNLTVHEAMPGHYLQMAHSRRFHGSTRARVLGFSSPFTEGWGVYAEQLMAEHGFGGLPVRIQQLKVQLRMTLNAILDQLVHCENLDEAEAMAMMTVRAFQEEGEAAVKWRRALLTSTQLSTYFVGYTEVSAIAGSRPGGTSRREWHDAMLAHGSPAPRHVAALLG